MKAQAPGVAGPLSCRNYSIAESLVRGSSQGTFQARIPARHRAEPDYRVWQKVNDTYPATYSRTGTL